MNKTIGVLVFVDVVDFTPQANQAGSGQCRAFELGLEALARERADRHRGNYIKRQGDGVLVFFQRVDDFLPFALELRGESMRGELDCFDFDCRVRIVGDYGRFNLVRDEKEPGTIRDVSGAKPVTLFRIEKQGGPFDIIITGGLLDFIDEQLNEKGITHKEIFSGILKGFKRSTTVYCLEFPAPEEMEKTVLAEKMAELETGTRFIPVFGDIYKPMSMEHNFVDLDIETETRNPGQDREDMRKKQLERMDNEWEDADSYLFHRDKQPRAYMKSRNVKDIYRDHYRGVIFGLPGSGKTTILKYFAYRDYKRNREESGTGKHRLVLLVECRDLASYNQWRVRPGQGERHTVEWMLKWLTHGFLFPGGERGEVEPAQVEAAERAVKSAFYRGCLTLLVDALDEAPGLEVKDDVLSALRLLCAESNEGKRKFNRVFLTARVFEKEHILATDPEGVLEPVFDVRSLDLSQIREMAKHFYGKKPKLYKAFDEMVWKEEIPARVGGTPLTALLVIAYYESFESLDNRYHMYHVLLTFILARTWKRIKDGDFKMDMKTYFKEAHSGRLLKADPDAERLYNALSLLSFGYVDIGRVLNKRDILKVLGSHKASPWGSETGYAEQLLDRLVEEHLLVSAGVGKFVFIHATVMEYLAARFLVKRWADSSFMGDTYPEDVFAKNLETKPRIFYESETLPIAIGVSIGDGLRVMEYIMKRMQAADPGDIEIFYRLGVRALAEWESCVARMRDETRLDFLRADADQLIEKQKHVLDWVYDYLVTEVMGSDKEKLKSAAEEFQSVSKLSLPEFLERLNYDVFCQGEREVVRLREALLEAVVRRDILEPWLTSHRNIQREKEEAAAPPVKIEPGENEDIFLIEPLANPERTFEPDEYVTNDERIFYYRSITGPELIGISDVPDFGRGTGVLCIAVSPDNRHLLSGSVNRSLKLWDMSAGRTIREYKGHRGSVWCVAFSPDGTTFASSSFDQTVKLWDRDTGSTLREFKGHEGGVLSVAFSPNGTTVVSGSVDKTVKLWDQATGKTIRDYIGHAWRVNGVAFSPDGSTIVSGSSDHTLILWDRDTGNIIREFNGHKDSVRCVAFSPEGKAIISCSNDNTLKIWNPQTAKNIKTIPLPWIPYEIHLLPKKEGIYATLNGNRTITFLDLRKYFV